MAMRHSIIICKGLASLPLDAGPSSSSLAFSSNAPSTKPDVSLEDPYRSVVDILAKSGLEVLDLETERKRNTRPDVSFVNDGNAALIQ